MNILAFAASSSQQSINKQLVTYASSLLPSATINILDLNDYELPLFSEDQEKRLGQPALAQAFVEQITQSDGILISYAEHNGSYSTAYKNLFDWCSRINPKVFQDKPMVLLSTSPGARGGANVLKLAVESAPRFSGNVVGSLSIPSFYDHFDAQKGQLTDEALRTTLENTVKNLIK